MSLIIDKQLPLSTLEDYRLCRESFRLACPELFNFGVDVVDNWAQRRPFHPAMRWTSSLGDDRTISFEQMANRSNQVANGLLALGLRHGDQVLVDLPNLVEWWEVMVRQFVGDGRYVRDRDMNLWRVANSPQEIVELL